jgi:hypothetical protein
LIGNVEVQDDNVVGNAEVVGDGLVNGDGDKEGVGYGDDEGGIEITGRGE